MALCGCAKMSHDVIRQESTARILVSFASTIARHASNRESSTPAAKQASSVRKIRSAVEPIRYCENFACGDVATACTSE